LNGVGRRKYTVLKKINQQGEAVDVKTIN